MLPVDDEVASVFLKPETVSAIYEDLLSSSSAGARMLRMTLSDSLPLGYLQAPGTNILLELDAAVPPTPQKMLDAAIRRVTKDGETVTSKTFSEHFENSKNWGLALLQEYFHELRRKVCGKGKTPAALGQAADAALLALGAAICKFLGISSPMGMGIAVLVVTNAAWIGKTALCKMTSPEQLAKYFA